MQDLSFFNLLEQYVKEKSLSDATITTYTNVIRKFTSDTDITHLDQVTFERLLDWRLSVRNRASDITWNNYLRHMRALWNFASHKSLVQNDKLFSDLNWGKYNSSKKKTLSGTQIRTILAYLSSQDCSFEPPWFWVVVIRFIYYTGLRRKQVVSLTWGDVNFKRQIIYLSAESEKTDIAREIPIGDELSDILKEYRQQIFESPKGTIHPDSQIFDISKLNGKFSPGQLTVTQLSGFFKRLSKKVGFKVSPHMLRHTMATEIAKTGKIKQLQEILGHQDVRTTLTFYVHPDLKELGSLINKLPSI